MGEAPNHALHLGAMDWTPNVQGVMWLKDEVWPLVNQAVDEACLKLAGRHMPKTLFRTPIVASSCWVKWRTRPTRTMRLAWWWCRARRLWHADQIGRGTCGGRPVVTTSKGMEGLPLQAGTHVLVADTTEEMAAAIVTILTDPPLAISLGKAGREWALDHLSHRARARELTRHLTTWVEE